MNPFSMGGLGALGGFGGDQKGKMPGMGIMQMMQNGGGMGLIDIMKGGGMGGMFGGGQQQQPQAQQGASSGLGEDESAALRRLAQALIGQSSHGMIGR